MSNDKPDWGELVLDSMHFKLNGPLQPSAVDRLAPKLTIGDYSKDSNDLLSAWVIGDLTGGNGVSDLKEGVDDTRYRFSTLYTRYPNQISKPYAITAADIGGSYNAVRPLGDINDSGTFVRMTTADSDLFADTTNVGTSGASQFREKGVAFAGTATDPVFYVPTLVGYTVYRPSDGAFRNSTAIIMKSFCLWDDKLIGISTAGQLYYAITAETAADTTFASYGTAGKLDSSYTAISLKVFYNRAGEPAIHVITDQNVWVFDPATPRLYPIPDFGSVHTYFGEASAVWRGELYVAAGMDILAYNGSVVRNVGLSRDQGLPYSFQGRVSDLVAGQNSLYALVTSNGARYSIHEWSGIGWHCLYVDPTTSHSPTQMAISQHGSPPVYRLYWGRLFTGAYFYQDLPVAFTNPRSAIEDASIVMGDFTNSHTVGGFDFYNTLYYLETGKFNANMAGYNKIANAIELDIRTMDSATETCTIKYRINNETSWTTLGSTTVAGHHQVFQFGTLANGIYPGIEFDEIEFRLEVQDELPSPYVQTTSFVLDNMVFSFLPIKNPSLAWTAQVDLSSTHNNQSPANMLAKLTTLRTQGTFFAMVDGATTYRVRLAGFGGSKQLGQDTRGLYTLQIVEIPEQLGIPT